MKEEIKVIDYQILATYIYIGSLILSLYLTYNEKRNLLNPKNEQDKYFLSVFNRSLVLVISFFYLYINYKSFIIAKEKKEDLIPFKLQIISSKLSIISALIVLYVVINDGNYSIVTSVETPSIQ